MNPRGVTVVLAAILTIAFACSSETGQETAATVISDKEVVARTTAYLDSIEGPQITLWEADGAPVFFPQSCAEFVGLKSEENIPVVSDDGGGNYLVTVNDIRGQVPGEIRRWRFDPSTGEIASLQVPC